MSDLAARLRELRQQSFGAILDLAQSKPAVRKLLEKLAVETGHAATALDSAARRERELRDLYNERKWSVTVDNDGRMEDALLAVDVARIMGWDTPEKGEKGNHDH